MNRESESFMSPLGGASRARIEFLHSRLLQLHKVLLDDDRIQFEKKNGRIETSGRMLNLVMFDPWFDWLHRISELIVQIDELLESREATLDDAYTMIARTRAMFKADPEENEFARRYREALQREPGAVLAHAEVQRALYTDS